MTPALRRILAALLALTLLFGFAGLSSAQTPPDFGARVGAAAAGAETGGAAQGASGRRSESAIEMTQQQVGAFRQNAQRVFGAMDEYFDRIGATLAKASPDGAPAYFLGVLLFTVILLVIGRGGVSIYGMWIALPIMLRLQKPNPAGVVEKLPVLAARVGLQLVGLVIVLVIALAVGAGFYTEDEATLKTVIAIVGAYALMQLIDVLWRMIFSPFLPDYRIPSLSDRDARRLYRWLSFGSFFAIATNFFGVWLREIGADEEVIALTFIGVTAVAVILLFIMMVHCGPAISLMLRGGASRRDASLPAALASMLWAPALAAYFIFALAEMSYRLVMGMDLGTPLLAGAFGVLLISIVAYAVTIYVIERIFHRARAIRAANRAAARAALAEGEDEAALRDRLAAADDDDDGDEGGGGMVEFPAGPPPKRREMRSFEDLARRTASLFALLAGGYALVWVWMGGAAFAEGEPLDVARDLFNIALLGYLAYHAARIWMDRKIEEEGGFDLPAEPGDEGGAGAAATRLATILPLFRSFVLVVILVAVLLLFLLKLGVNIAPLIGGAGVVGLAIGFGAQSLVRDILSGVFFLSDDAFRKGEYIDIGDVKGTVEKISLRSFQLRHHLGALNTVPFGEIKFLTNYSRDWVMMKLPLRLTYDTDVDKVRKLIKKLGQDLLNHPVEGRKFVQPLKSQGVYMMEDSAMIIRVKFMTRPGDQWTTRKLVYQEIRALFAREGIKFAHKEVTVRIPELEDGARDGALTPQEQQAIGAAARRVVEEETPPKAMADDR
ncbi:MAG: mechanosensitive ion channel family protein [Pikeienuella sp.]